jgi:hypothetical protein
MDLSKLTDWLKQSISDHLDWVNVVKVNDGTLTKDEFLELWIKWLGHHDFIKVFGSADDPSGYLIARPARISWVLDAEIDYFKTLFIYDQDGEVVWIDSLWAPGHYADVLTFLRSTTKTYVSWSHGNKLFFKVIKELSGTVPNRAEIKEGFWDLVH